MGKTLKKEQPQKPKNDALEMLESPWLRRQVETHLIFGILARDEKGYYPTFFKLDATPYQKSALFLASIKFSGFLISFLLILGSFIAKLRNDPDAPIALALGIIWMPALEFIPKVTPHQKYITIARILLTLIIIVFFILPGM